MTKRRRESYGVYSVGDKGMEHPKENPWKRELDEKLVHPMANDRRITNTINELFPGKSAANRYTDINSKRAVMGVSASVVSLVSSIGGEVLLKTTGTILDCCKQLDGTYSSTVLTSRSLLGSSSADDIKIDVCIHDGSVFTGRVFAHDPHYNLAIFNIHSDRPFPYATLRLLDDSLSIDPRENISSSPGDHHKFMIRPHSDLFTISPGDKVIAVGRLDLESRLMVAPGEFSLDCCRLDCTELLRTSCRITMCGTGGPLINSFGEVIGINFFQEKYTPFLPINVVSKWLAHFKEHKRFPRPCLGMGLANLYAAPMNKLEIIIQNFPKIFKGVIVEKVIPGSLAESAGILADDIIIQCNQDSVGGFLEFIGKVFNNVGETMNVTVIRKGCDALLNLAMLIDETKPDKFNSWPLPKIYETYVE